MIQEKKIHYCDISISKADYEITEDKIVIYNVPITGEIVQFYDEENFTGNMFKPLDELKKMVISNTPITFMHPNKLLMDFSTKEVSKLTEGILREPSLNRKNFVNDGKIYADMIVNRGSEQSIYLENRLKDDEPVDVSIGFMSNFKEEKGEYNGKSYELVQTDHELDHLAILIDPQGSIYPGRAGVTQGYGIGMDHNKQKMTDSNNKLMDTVVKRNDELVAENAKLGTSLSDMKSQLKDAESIKIELADAKEKLKSMDSIEKKLKKYTDAEANVLKTMKEALKKKYPAMDKLFDEASAETVKEQFKKMQDEAAKDPKGELQGFDGSDKDVMTDMDLYHAQNKKEDKK